VSVESIRQEISQYEASAKRRLQELAQMRVSITNDVKPYMKDKLKEIIERQVRDNPDHTKALGAKKLGEMKAKFGIMIDTSDSIVDSVFADEKLWMHINYSITSDYGVSVQSYADVKKAGENIHDGIRAIMGNAGSLLLEYEYIKMGTPPVVWRWKEQFGSRNSKMIYAAHPLSLPETINEKTKKYSDGIRALHDDLYKLYSLGEDLSKQEASDLWEQV